MRVTNLVVLLALAACDRPTVSVICHNANCVGPTDPKADDTLPAMRESLALQIGGKPAIDAVEIDSYWRGSDNTCLLAHDLLTASNTPFAEAADEAAAYIMNAPVLTRHDVPFRVFVEMKDHTDKAEEVEHTAEQLTMHADCAWDAYARIANAAMLRGTDVEVVFASFGPRLLREIIARKPPTTPIPYKLDTFYGIPKPLSSETRPLSEYGGIPIDIIEIHPQWLNDAQWEGVRSEGFEVVFWMFSATVETFAAIEQYEPESVGTSEAQLMVRWLEN